MNTREIGVREMGGHLGSPPRTQGEGSPLRKYGLLMEEPGWVAEEKGSPRTGEGTPAGGGRVPLCRLRVLSAFQANE